MKKTLIEIITSIILCLGLLIFFALLDKPNAQKNISSAKPVSTEKEKSNITSTKQDQNTATNSKEEGTGIQTLTLAVGTTGNLKEKTGEPIYASPEEDSDIIATLQFHCSVLLEEENIIEGWSQVSLQDKTGYVKTSGYRTAFLSIGDITNSPARNGIIKDAVHYIGLPFKRYGKSLENGIDCSNYIQQIYKMNGIIIRNRPNSMKEDSIIIEEKDALPGDVVYYNANNGEGHVGIYLGEDQNGTKFIINTAGHAGRTYPEGGCRICEIQYMDREEYIFCRLF